MPLFEESETPCEVDAVSGACLMIKRSIFEDVGMFSTTYFMYSEDIDLCFKTKLRGLKNYYIPFALVVHHGGVSTAESRINTFSSIMLVESRWRFFLQQRSQGYGLLYRGSIIIGSCVRLVIAIIMRHLGSTVNKQGRQQGIIQKWKARLKWAIGLEGWAAKY